MDINKLNLLGAYSAIFILLISSLIFIFRLLDKQTVEFWLGIAFILSSIPLIYLIITAPQLDRPTLYYIQLGIMISFIIVELLLDYIFKVDFRHTNWMTITYVTLFFAGTGGMIGIASNAGKFWMLISIILFIIMTALAFFQRTKTGL